MKLRDLVLLLPSYELESFPRSLSAEAARDLLSGWIALWHPQLLAAAQGPPRWHSAAQLPTELHDILFVLPEISREQLEPEAESRIGTAGGKLLFPRHAQWREFQRELLEVARSSNLLNSTPDNPSQVESTAYEASSHIPADVESVAAVETIDALLAEFAALGYAFLQIQLMTRQLRYTSNLDLLLFGQHLTEAAQATLNGDRESAQARLQTCFDALGQERDHYYSLDVHLLDVTLLASSTLGKSLTAELERAGQANHPPTSFLACGQLLRELQQQRPEQLERLQAAVQQRQASLVGGLDLERPHPLMSREAVARDFSRGRQVYQACGFEPPRVFARHSYGLHPDSVPMLRRWGLEGCLLIAWSGGSYPLGAQAKISWEAPDGTFLAALATTVLDASNPASYLALGWTVGEALDHQHVPTILFAHWPNQSCELAELLAIVAQRTPALGKWQLVDDYFANTDQPYHQERLTAEGFRFNWLLEAASLVQHSEPTKSNPSAAGAMPAAAAGLIRAAELSFRLTSRCRSLQNLLNIAWQLEHFYQLGGTRPESPLDHSGEATPVENTPVGITPDASEVVYQALPLRDWSAGLAELTDQVDGLLDAPHASPGRAEELNRAADELRTEVMERLARQLLKPTVKKSSSPNDSTTHTGSTTYTGRLMLNPRSAAVRVSTHTLPNQQLAAADSWHFAEGRVGEGRVTRVDIPSVGFVAAAIQAEQRTTTSKQQPLADAGGLLSNEFLELQIDQARGHIRSLHVPAKRGNRLSLMLARRDQLPSDSKRPPSTATGKAVYSQMVASDVRMLTSSNICGVVRAMGQFEMDGRRVGKFEIIYEVWRGSRIIEVNIRLSELSPLASDNPWQSAYILRLAWPTESAILRTYAGTSRHTWSSGRAVTPSLIEIDEVDYRTHYLPGGLPFHRRSEERFLETVLAVQGETQAEHRIGVAVDLPHPTLAAEQFVDTPYELTVQRAEPIQSTSGWLVSVDSRSVTADLEAPLVDAAGKLVGLRLFVAELEGKSSSAQIRLLREIASAARVDYLGGKIGKLTARGDRLTIALRAHEQVCVDVLWK
jgi:hypothetical protein